MQQYYMMGALLFLHVKNNTNVAGKHVSSLEQTWYTLARGWTVRNSPTRNSQCNTTRNSNHNSLYTFIKKLSGLKNIQNVLYNILSARISITSWLLQVMWCKVTCNAKKNLKIFLLKQFMATRFQNTFPNCIWIGCYTIDALSGVKCPVMAHNISVTVSFLFVTTVCIIRLCDIILLMPFIIWIDNRHTVIGTLLNGNNNVL